MKLKDLEHSAGAQNTNSVASLSDNQVVKVTGLKSTYRYKVGDFGMSAVSITTFLSPKLGKRWVGPEQDFYVESPSDMMGASLHSGGLLYWCDSLATGTNVSRATLNAMTQTFETDTELVTVLKTLGPEANEEARSRRVTDLRQVFGPWAFTNGKFSSQSSMATKIKSIEAENGEIKLTIENPASDFKGIVWINASTKKATKARENDRDVSVKK